MEPWRLSEGEVKRTRKLIEKDGVILEIVQSHERFDWLVKSLRIWASWISAAIIGGWGLAEIIGKALKFKAGI